MEKVPSTSKINTTEPNFEYHSVHNTAHPITLAEMSFAFWARFPKLWELRVRVKVVLKITMRSKQVSRFSRVTICTFKDS